MAEIFRYTLFACAAALVTACGAADRLTAPAPVPSQSSPAPPFVWPAPNGPATIYVFSGPLGARVSHFTVNSRFVLYETGAFTLEYQTSVVPYYGTYEREHDRATFRFSGADGAIGTFKDHLLEIRFSERMQHSDFEDAVYRRDE